VSLLILVIYLGCVFLCWNELTWARPRHTLGEACWPAGFTSDGRHVVTYKRWWRRFPGGSREESTGPVELWNLHSGAVAASVLDEQTFLHAVELSANDRWLAVQEGKYPKHGKLRVFELASGKEKAAFDVPADATKSWHFFRFSPDGRTFAAYTGTPSNEQVTIWDLHQERPARVLRDTNHPFEFTPDGQYLAAAVPEKLLKDPQKGEFLLLEVATGKVCGRYHLRKGLPWVYVTFSPDGARLYATCFESPVSGLVRHTCAWDVKTGRELFWLEDAWQPRFLSDGKTLALNCLRGTEEGFSLIDAKDGTERAYYPGRFAEVAARPGLEVPVLVSNIQRRAKPSLFELLFGENNVQQPGLTRYDDVEVRDAETGQTIATISRGDRIPIPFLTPDRSTLLLTVSNGPQDILEVWDLPPQTAWEWCAVALVGLTALFAGGFWFIRRCERKIKPRVRDAPSFNC
jgi:hypothetical protein